MKLLLDIADEQKEDFLKVLNQFKGLKASPISSSNAALFEDILKIKTALRNAEKIEKGGIKYRPAADLLADIG